MTTGKQRPVSRTPSWLTMQSRDASITKYVGSISTYGPVPFPRRLVSSAAASPGRPNELPPPQGDESAYGNASGQRPTLAAGCRRHRQDLAQQVGVVAALLHGKPNSRTPFVIAAPLHSNRTKSILIKDYTFLSTRAAQRAVESKAEQVRAFLGNLRPALSAYPYVPTADETATSPPSRAKKAPRRRLDRSRTLESSWKHRA
jgi:hypothetical protein